MQILFTVNTQFEEGKRRGQAPRISCSNHPTGRNFSENLTIFFLNSSQLNSLSICPDEILNFVADQFIFNEIYSTFRRSVSVGIFWPMLPNLKSDFRN